MWKSREALMNINNRRYTGSKYKLMPWIKELIIENCPEHETLFDVFGGTGVVTAELLDYVDKVIINDFLYSNEIIYKAFFEQEDYSGEKIDEYSKRMNEIDRNSLVENYISINYGGKYFEYSDAKLIGYIREKIQEDFQSEIINEKEFCILVASLLYSLDRCANTVGHYEAFIKGKEIRSRFQFELIEPIQTNKEIVIYRRDSNELANEVTTDIAFVDPPYNSRQYSRFYHVLETITKWDRPILSGVAMKPPAENMSDYCRNSAPDAFQDLVSKLDAKYIVVTYNNTYDTKSASSINKIALEQIEDILQSKGDTKVFSKDYQRFNAGKTDESKHKELVFITKVD